MRCKHIHAINAWRKNPDHYDCVFVSTDPVVEEMHALTSLSCDFNFYLNMKAPTAHVPLYIGTHV